MSHPYAYNAQPAFPPPNRGYGNSGYNGYNTPPTFQQPPPPQHYPQQQHHNYNGSGGFNQPSQAQAMGRSPVEAFRAYYADRLKELTFNSRPLIQDLSIMAMQQRDNGNWDNMAGVVEEIEIAVYRPLYAVILIRDERQSVTNLLTAQSPPSEKLPKLYLLDSISKNIGAPYTTHFLPAIIPRLYIRTYRDVDGVTRNKMTEMIGLWRRSGPNGADLYGTPVREEVEREIFGGRPAPARTPVNAPTPTGYNTPPPAPIPAVPIVPEGPGKQEVLDAINITIQAKHAEAAQKPWDASVKTQLGALMGLSEMVMTKPIPAGELKQIMDQLKGMGYVKQQAQAQVPVIHAPAPVNALHQQAQAQFGGRSPVPAVSFGGSGSAHVAQGLGGGADISSILMGLTSTGILGGSRTPDVPVKKDMLQEYEDMVLSLDVSLTNLDLNRFTVVPLDHLPVKCSQCSHRFPAEGADLDAHMDWHVRRNRSERQSAGRGAHRRWLPRAEEWEKEIPSFGAPPAESSAMGAAAAASSGQPAGATGDAAVPAKSQASVEYLKRKFVRVPPGQQGGAGGEGETKCPVCKEAFKAEWSEDEEEWVWRNAININGKIYHATCRAESLASKQRAKAAGIRNSASGTKSPTKSASPGRTPEPASVGTPQRHPLSHSVLASDADVGASAAGVEGGTAEQGGRVEAPSADEAAAREEVEAEAGTKRKASIEDDEAAVEERKKVKLEEGMDGAAVVHMSGEQAAGQGGIEAQAAIDAASIPTAQPEESDNGMADGGGQGMTESHTSPSVPAPAEMAIDTATDTPQAQPAEESVTLAPAFTFDSDMLKTTLAGLQGFNAPSATETSGSTNGGSGIPGFSL